MSKCPLCNKHHKYQHTAQKCFQEVIISCDMQVIANRKLSESDKESKQTMKEYYYNLPIHKRYKKLR